jgi:hypothetical protein
MSGFRPVVSSPSLVACLAGILVFVCGAGILLGPIVNGHDTYISFSHAEIWVSALKAGDLVSTWTPVDANGFGSPVPFFYHKLFNIVAAALTLASGDIVTGCRLGVLFFAAVMLYGTCICAARLGADRCSQLVIGIACVLSPYGVICLVARGAFAEYSAMALVPLGIALTVDLFVAPKSSRRAFELFLLLVCLALAHLIIFLAADGMLIGLALYLIVRSPGKGVRLLAASASALLLFVVLIYVPFTVWGAYFCPGQAQIHGLPADNAVSFIRIFSPNPGSWFAWPIPVLLIGLAIQFRHRHGHHSTIAITLGVAAFLMTLCMTQLAAPLWRSSELLNFVQFPWRLLSITTPMIFVAFAGMLEQMPATPKRYAQLGLLAITAFNVAGGLLAVSNIYTTISIAELRHEKPSSGPGPDAGGEYFPARYQEPLAASPDILKVKASSVLPGRRSLVDSTGGCSFRQIAGVSYFGTLQISASCETDGTLEINQFSTPFLAITATNAERGMIAQPIRGEPFIELPLSRGNWTVRVRQRSYMELVKMAWEKKLGLGERL